MSSSSSQWVETGAWTCGDRMMNLAVDPSGAGFLIAPSQKLRLAPVGNQMNLAVDPSRAGFLIAPSVVSFEHLYGLESDLLALKWNHVINEGMVRAQESSQSCEVTRRTPPATGGYSCLVTTPQDNTGASVKRTSVKIHPAGQPLGFSPRAEGPKRFLMFSFF